MFKKAILASKRCYSIVAPLFDHTDYFIRKAVGDADRHRTENLLIKSYLPFVHTVFEVEGKENTYDMKKLDGYLGDVQKNHVLLVAIAKQSYVTKDESFVPKEVIGSVALTFRVNVVDHVFKRGNYISNKNSAWKPECLTDNDAYLDLLVTAENFRKRGVATNLNKCAIELARENGMARIFAHVSKNNKGSISVLNKSVLKKIGSDMRVKDLEYLYGHRFPKNNTQDTS